MLRCLLLFSSCLPFALGCGGGDSPKEPPPVVAVEDEPRNDLPDVLKDVEPETVGQIRDIQILNAEPGKGEAIGPARGRTHAQFLPGGDQLVIANGYTVVWDLKDNKEVRKLGEMIRPRAHNVGVSPDGTRAMVPCGFDYSFRTVDTRTGKDVKRFATDISEIINAIAVTPDGKHVVTISAGAGREGIWVWDVATGARLRGLKLKAGGASDIAVSPDGKHLAVASGTLIIPRVSRKEGGLIAKDGPTKRDVRDACVRIFDFESGDQVAQMPTPDRVLSVGFSFNGKHLAAGCADGTLFVFDTAAWKESRKWNAHPGPVGAVAFSPDNGLIATGGGWEQASGKSDGSVRVWKAAGGEPLHTFKGWRMEVQNLHFSPDSRYLVGSGGAFDGTARVWRIE